MLFRQHDDVTPKSRGKRSDPHTVVRHRSHPALTNQCHLSAIRVKRERSVSDCHLCYLCYIYVFAFANTPQVKCDRDDPCGNCVDSQISCRRTAAAVRNSRNAQKRRTVPEASSVQAKKRHAPDVTPSPTSYSPSVSQSPSVIEAQGFIRREIGSGQYMSTERLEVLNAAMSFVNRLLQSAKPDAPASRTTHRVVDVLDGITYPSIELLYWMLRGGTILP